MLLHHYIDCIVVQRWRSWRLRKFWCLVVCVCVSTDTRCLPQQSDKTYHTKHTPLNTKIYDNTNFSIVAEHYSQCGGST
jgi:hypothetical protein